MCQRLAPLLRRLGISHVNLWVLDVEGAELEILRGMDWHAVTFDVISVETAHLGPGGAACASAGVVGLAGAGTVMLALLLLLLEY
jgi:hypothetical protein